MACIIVLTMSACGSGRQQINLEKRENAKVDVRGYDLIGRSYEKEAYSVFLGPWVDDPVPLVNQPGVQLAPPQYSESDKRQEMLAEGRFVEPGGQRCWLHVSRFRAHVDPGDYWGLSMEQRRAVISGTNQLLVIRTGCEGSL